MQQTTPTRPGQAREMPADTHDLVTEEKRLADYFSFEISTLS